MGSELSCPCGNRQEEDKTDTPKVTTDIIQEVMKGKLLHNQLLYSNVYEKDDTQTKICLISSSQLESFFANRSLLTISAKKEVNYYFNNIFVANFLEKDNLVFILLQYKPGLEDKSTFYVKTQSNFAISNKRRITNSFDYSAVYKVETINFVSTDRTRMKEQILNDLESKLKKEFLFYGIVNDPIYSTKGDRIGATGTLPTKSNTPMNTWTPTPTPGITTVKFDKNFKILSKKSKMKENLDIFYSIYTHEGTLDCDGISEILIDHKLRNKTLKSVMKENTPYKNYFYFIFEESLSNKVDQDFEFLVFKISKDKNTPDMFLNDMARKINDENRINLMCIINDEDGVFLIFSVLEYDLETPYENPSDLEQDNP